jgi:quercetin dioxygenase-like cupin family protein
VYHHLDVPAEVAEQGAVGTRVRWLLTAEQGAKTCSMRLFEVEPEGYTPFHSHPWEHEVYVLEGEGEVRGGAKVRRFSGGDVIFIPAGERHQLKNAGSATVKFLCLIPIRR